MPRGDLTSSASIRASLVANVFVLPLPGPARTTQWPVESNAFDCPGFSRNASAAFMYAAGISRNPLLEVRHGAVHIVRTNVFLYARREPLRKTPLAYCFDITDETIGIQ